jgi:hypothetical protein
MSSPTNEIKASAKLMSMKLNEEPLRYWDILVRASQLVDLIFAKKLTSCFGGKTKPVAEKIKRWQHWSQLSTDGHKWDLL